MDGQKVCYSLDVPIAELYMLKCFTYDIENTGWLYKLPSSKYFSFTENCHVTVSDMGTKVQAGGRRVQEELGPITGLLWSKYHGSL